LRISDCDYFETRKLDTENKENNIAPTGLTALPANFGRQTKAFEPMSRGVSWPSDFLRAFSLAFLPAETRRSKRPPEPPILDHHPTKIDLCRPQGFFPWGFCPHKGISQKRPLDDGAIIIAHFLMARELKCSLPARNEPPERF